MIEELKARDIMTPNPIVLKRGVSVKKAAEIFTEKGIGGAPVVDDEGRIVGMVSSTDLIMRDVRLRYPTVIHVLDSFIYLPNPAQRFNEELRKAVGARVEDVMSERVVAVDPDATIEDVATLMVDHHVDRVPVVEDSKPIGIITKADIVRTISR
ncbi:MAG: CBS domain-containing protein [Actinobacteria bacterium]|nr:CBS domain-containing protein [Actinomycetota bacterium]